jgi:tRNA wybutosine-synthesizing protein 4
VADASGINFSARRSPLINRGYYSRVSALDKIIRQFLAVAKEQGTGSQIVSLGAGFDTSYWRLKFHHNLRADKYIEVDFSSSVAQKLIIIDHCEHLQQVLAKDNHGPVTGAGVVNGQVDNETAQPYRRYDDFGIVGADLRDISSLTAALTLAGADFDLPTLFVSECVLVYMQPHDSTRVLQWAANGPFTKQLLLATYEQIHPDDPFGRTMMFHLANRGCALLGLLEYPDIPAQRARFLNSGFSRFQGWPMNDVYANFLDKDEVVKAERLELFDELEEWHMIQGHYAISIGYRGAKDSTVDADAEKEKEKEETKEAKESVDGVEAPLSCGFSRVGFLGLQPPRERAGARVQE